MFTTEEETGKYLDCILALCAWANAYEAALTPKAKRLLVHLLDELRETWIQSAKEN